MTLIDVLRAVHVVAGTVALGAFWIPLVVTKGSRLHRRAGWTYAIAMWVATVGAWLICAIRWTDGDRGNDAAAIFLAFVGLLAANGAATGIRVLRTRARTPRRAGVFDLASSTLFLVAAVALGGWGVAKGAPLPIAFGVLGVFLAARQLHYWLRAPATKFAWWTTHLGNMIGACIGTVTAFLVVNVPRFGLEQYGLLFWLGPGVVGGVAIAAWTQHYRNKFTR